MSIAPQKTEWILHQRRSTDGKYAHEKCTLLIINENLNHPLEKLKSPIMQRYRETGPHIHSWQEYKMLQPLWKTLAIPQHIKHGAPI